MPPSDRLEATPTRGHRFGSHYPRPLGEGTEDAASGALSTTRRLQFSTSSVDRKPALGNTASPKQLRLMSLTDKGSKQRFGGLVQQPSASPTGAWHSKTAGFDMSSGPSQVWMSLAEDQGDDILQEIEQKQAPNVALQLAIVLYRSGLKHLRDFYPTIVIDLVLLMCAAIIVGAIHGTHWEQYQAAGNTVMAMTTLATLSGVTFVRTFSKVRARDCAPATCLHSSASSASSHSRDFRDA